MPARRFYAGAAALLVVGACTIFRPLDGISGGSLADGGEDAEAGLADVAADVPIDVPADVYGHCFDQVKDGDETDVDCGGPTCAPCAHDGACLKDRDCATRHCVPNPAGGGRICTCPDDMAAVEKPGAAGKYCVDRTEVTRDAYAAFVTSCANGACAGAQPGYCAFNKSFAPDNGTGSCNGVDNSTGAQPVTCVDWCDAYAFCALAGKRMCGAYGAGPTKYNGFDDPAQSEWFNACSLAKRYDYPYGAQTLNAFEQDRCNGAPHTDVFAAGSLANCQGAFPNLFDMSGNAWEWEASCNTDTGDADRCRARGGAFDSDQNFMKCGADFDAARSDVQRTIGFRCCSG